MAKQAPKYIVKKVERMCDLMEQIVALNVEVEEWLEKNGIESGSDFTFDYRDERGYAIWNVNDFINAVNDAIN